MGIQVKHITKKFHNIVVLDDVSLEVKSGELIALLGPSGSGKTTLLRIIAGLEFADSGMILLDGEETQTKSIKERNVGFVFQHYALFEHMTVFKNVAFGLNVERKKHRATPYQIKRKVMRLLKLVHLEKFRHHYPKQLSGGQRQRVALVRALATNPRVLLLDEPFGALDAKVRKHLRRWIRKLHDEIHITSIFVTHDQEEAMEVADRIVVMCEGRIKQIGTPEEVWRNPADSFVYDFLGSHNEFDGWQDHEGNIHLVESDIKVPPARGKSKAAKLERYPIISHFINRFVPRPKEKKEASRTDHSVSSSQSTNGKVIKLYARPHEMYITKNPEDHEFITAVVISINFTGSLIKLELERKNGKILQVEVTKEVVEELKLKKGEMLYVRPNQFDAYEGIENNFGQ